MLREPGRQARRPAVLEPRGMSVPTAHLVDDDARFRESVSALLEAARIRTVSYGDGFAFLDAHTAAMEGCLVLDIRMPGLSGLEVQAELVKRGSPLPVIILSGYGDIETTVKVMKAGAVDVLTKPVPTQALVNSVQAALRLHERRSFERRAAAYARLKISLLTQRELEIMKLIVNGASSKEVARQLGISFRTVEVHRTHIMEKMDADSILSLAAMAGACGIAAGRLPPGS
jgi:two-component system response regulator FixJ